MKPFSILKIILFWLFMGLLILLFVRAVSAQSILSRRLEPAAEKVEETKRQLVGKFEQAVRINHGIALIEVSEYISHVLRSYPERRKKALKLAPVIVKYSLLYSDENVKIDPLLVSLIIYLESSFRPQAVNTRENSKGERGLMQMHGGAARGVDFDNPEDQIRGGIHHLRKCFDACRNERQAINMYGTGRCTPILQFAKRRHRLYKNVIRDFRIN